MTSPDHHDESPVERARRLGAERSARWRRRQGIQPRELAPCGTPAAYVRHLRHDETPCEACLASWREYYAERRSADEEST